MLARHASVYIPFFCGAAIVLVSLLVMFGWLTHDASLVQIHSTFAAMKFNTAVCFFLCGTTLLLLPYRRRVGLLTSTAITLFSLLIIFQYLTHVSLGINNFFITPDASSKAFSTGQMSPNSAVGFLLVGTSLFLLSLRRLPQNYVAVVAVFGSIVAAIGAVPLLGYICGVEQAYSWDAYMQMALHTAACFTILGICLVGSAWKRARAKAMWLPIPIFFGLVIVAVSMSQAVRTQEETDLNGIFQAQAEHMGREVNQQLKDLYGALNRITTRWTAANATSEELWTEDAKSYLHDFPFLTALSRTDAQTRILWLVTRTDDKSAIGFQLNSESRRASAIEKALKLHGPQVSVAVTLLTGNRGFLYVNPLYGAGDRYDGVQVAVFQLSDLFQHVLDEGDLKNYFVTIVDGDSTLFTNRPNGLDHSPWLKTITIDNMNNPWTLELVPTGRYLKAQKSNVPTVILGIGLFMAFLVSLCTFLLLKWKINNGILQAREIALAASSQMNQAILSSTDYMIIAIDLDGKVLVFNQQAEKALGYSAEEMIGKYTPMLWHDIDEVVHRAEQLSIEFNETIAAGLDVITRRPLRDGKEDGEWTYVRKNGKRFPVMISVTTLSDNSKVIGYLAVVRDITDRREVERIKNEFISVVSHELRTPLTSIRGALGLVVGGAAGAISEKIRDLLDIAHRNSERLVRIINDILDMEKMESGKLRLEIKPIRVATFLAEAVEANRAYGEKFNVRFRLEQVHDQLEMMGDADRLMQVMANLLSNAAKFSPGSSEVLIRSYPKAQRIIIEVQDAGPGIAPEFQSRIFGKFTQADASSTRKHEGTGLGLNIARQLVRLMGGDAGFRTEVGLGTTFFFNLPEASSALLLHLQQKHAEPAVATAPRVLPRVLHIEDDQDLNRILAEALKGQVELVPVSTLQEAALEMHDGDFKLIVLDLSLPDGSGLDFLDYIENFAERAPPVLILSIREVPLDVRKRVAGALVKLRVSEAHIANTIMSILHAEPIPVSH